MTPGNPPKFNRNKTLLQAGFISLIFSGIGFTIHQLPAQTCGLLHYESVKTDAKGIEFCKDEAGALLDLDLLKFPVKFNVTWQNGMLYVKLSDQSGDIFSPYEIAYSHTQKVHLFIIDETTHAYHHLHPEGDDITGEWMVPFSPKSSGTFRVFVQFVHAKTKRTLTAVSQILAEKGESAPDNNGDPRITVSCLKKPSCNQIGSTIPLSFEILHPDLGPLEPIMGAYAHAALFQYGNNHFGHLHPLASTETSKDKSIVNFLFNYNKKEPHILWLQFQLQGKPHFYRLEW